jgi:CDP-glucose 4,6-dehydratase
VSIREFSTNWQKKSPILVTGHTGFKGAWLTLVLRELGIQVVGYSLKAKPGSMYERLALEGEIPEAFGDIRDQSALRKFIEQHRPSGIIHLAAQPLVLQSYSDPKETFDVNVIGTANLIQSGLCSNNLESIVVSTTDKVYLNLNTGKRFVESDPLGGVDPYSASKVAAESVILAWQNILSGNIRLIAARAGNVIGGGDYSENRLIPDCVRAFESCKPVLVRNPYSQRPWQHVLEPVIGYLLSLEYGRDPAFNFGPVNASDLNALEVVELLKREFNFEYVIEKSKSQYYESTLLSLDSTLAQKNLGWRQIYSQEDAIRATGVWWSRAMNSSDLLEFTIFQIKNHLTSLGAYVVNPASDRQL